jgi:hypothetical protein
VKHIYPAYFMDVSRIEIWKATVPNPSATWSRMDDEWAHITKLYIVVDSSTPRMSHGTSSPFCSERYSCKTQI